MTFTWMGCCMGIATEGRTAGSCCIVLKFCCAGGGAFFVFFALQHQQSRQQINSGPSTEPTTMPAIAPASNKPSIPMASEHARAVPVAV